MAKHPTQWLNAAQWQSLQLTPEGFAKIREEMDRLSTLDLVILSNPPSTNGPANKQQVLNFIKYHATRLLEGREESEKADAHWQLAVRNVRQAFRC